MAFKHGTPNSIVTDGLVFCVDAANKVSWTGPNSATVNNLVGTNTGSIVNDTSGSYGDNNSFAFDGVSDYIDCGSNNIVTGAFTVSIWVKRSLTGGAGTQMFFGKTGTDGIRTFACYLTKSSGILQLFVSNTGSLINNKRILTTDVITDENWHHLVFINGGDSVLLKIYIDNSEAALSSSGRTGLSSLFNSSALNIIGDSNSVGSNDYSGNISNIQVYNRALTASEVAQNYNALKNRFRT